MKLRSPTGEVHDVTERGRVIPIRVTLCGLWPSNLGVRSKTRQPGWRVWELVKDDVETTCGRCKRIKKVHHRDAEPQSKETTDGQD